MFDHFAIEASEALRWAPATALFVIASAWPVKGAVFVGAAAVGDVRKGRLFPATAALAAIAGGAATAFAAILKEVFDRERPAFGGADVDPLVATPGSPSFPSGHAATAFATATLVAAFHPRLRVPAFALAAVVALSRVYLGVHFWLDVVAGAALGVLVGLACARAARRLARALAPLRG